MNDTRRFADHPIVSKARWLEARRALLEREKELTRQRDALGAARRALPWVRVEEPYGFETVDGRRTLAQLFAGRSQLAIYHFMFAPEWEAGCKSCSFWADTFNGITSHLAARDVTFAAISRAPLAKLQAFARRMGWTFPWASSFESRFNYDFGVSFAPDELASGAKLYNYAGEPPDCTDMPGISVFVKDASERVYHTYSCYARGIDAMNAAYQYLDLVPKGRDEDALDFSMAWVRHHDRYE
jgi:predicted dithiol-disulfide oxidoreductase (DUF899 family)